jgi:AcrR family transcriptional regulator
MSTEPPVTKPRGRPKGDKRTRTRAKLVEAAIAVIRERGYEGTTLASVAERAGMTTGAIYGNFKNRTDLLMAVADVKGGPISPRMWPGMSFRELMRSQAEAIIEAMPERRAAMVGALGFHIQTLTHEDLRQRVRAQTRDVYRQIADGLPRLIPAEQLPMPADLLAPVIHALIDGLVLRRTLTPELVADEVIYAAFDALAGSANDVSAEAPTQT